MKKYLISGAMALLAGFYLTSCTEKVEYETYYDEKMQTYEQVFKDLYGNIAPNHDWGFKSLNSIAASNTRMAGTRAENANANEWADPNKEYGGWVVPDPLTEGQILRVKAYFQANPNLDYKDPKRKNFFVQQVYKGGSSPSGVSTEKVVAANGSEYDSNNMNLLTVGQNAVHINNFNKGDATSLKVLDNGHTVNEIDTYNHYDKIMLMVNIDDTSCFGYHETGSSNESDPSGQHNDRCALVSAAVIDAWAEKNNIGGEKVLDDWNRSFLGFDLAIKEGDQIWSGETQKFTSGMNMGYDGLYYDADNTVAFEFDENWNRLMPNGQSDVMTDKEGNPLKLLISNTNFYSGDLKTLSDAQLRKDMGEGKVYVNMEPVMNLINQGYYPVSGSAFKTWVKPEESFDGYYSDWIVTLTQATRTNDTPGEIPDVPDTPTGQTVTKTSTGDQHKLIAIGRVFVEDLFRANREDLDFNDAVFDAAIWETTTNGTITVDETTGKKTFSPTDKSVVTREVEIYLIAAGGTIPLSIAGSKFGDVHDRFRQAGNSGVSGVTMVNTRGQYSTAFGSYLNGIKPVHDSFDYTTELKDKVTGEITLNDIAVNVIWTTDQFSVPATLNNARIIEYEKEADGITYKLDENGDPIVINTGTASAPHMICVPLGTPWATERVNIADCYDDGAFSDYVGDGVTEFWNQRTADSQFNLYEQNVTTFKKENYGDGTEELEPGKFCYYTNVQEVKKTLVEKVVLYENSNGTSGEIEVTDKDIWSKNNLSEGDAIRVYATATNQYYWQLYIQTGTNNTNWYINSIDLTPGFYDFVLDSSRASNLLNNTKDGRAALIGNANLMITKVVLCKAE